MITIIKLSIFTFLVKQSICMHFKPVSQVDFLINKEEVLIFPWTVLVYAISGDIYFEGSIIHRQVVLTVGTYESWAHYYEFQVFASCYNEYEGKKRILNPNCQQVRNIKEWSVIEKKEAYSARNFVVLILSEPFEMTEKVNVINLIKEKNDVDFENCAIVFYSDKCSQHNNCTLISKYFSTAAIRIYNEKFAETDYTMFYGRPYILDDQYQRYNLIEKLNGFVYIIFTESPVICTSTGNVNSWVQVGIANLSMSNVNSNGQLSFSGDIVRIDDQDITIFNKISHPFTV